MTVLGGFRLMPPKSFRVAVFSTEQAYRPFFWAQTFPDFHADEDGRTGHGLNKNEEILH